MIKPSMGDLCGDSAQHEPVAVKMSSKLRFETEENRYAPPRPRLANRSAAQYRRRTRKECGKLSTGAPPPEVGTLARTRGSGRKLREPRGNVSARGAGGGAALAAVRSSDKIDGHGTGLGRPVNAATAGVAASRFYVFLIRSQGLFTAS